jgi:putative endonuclease
MLLFLFHMFTTYILFSNTSQKFYTGHCENIAVRLSQHNSGRNKSTRHGIPWEMIFQASFETRGEAMNLEKRIKKRGAGRFLADRNIQLG